MLRVLSRPLGGLRGWKVVQRPASSTSLPAARFASTTPQPTSGLIIRNGKAVLYRGPPPMKTWVYIFIGGVFTYSGISVAHTLFKHMTFPLNWRDPNNPPKLVDVKIRTAVAGFVGAVGIVTGYLFFTVPSVNIIKLTLLVPTRQLVIRTTGRGFSALLPRALFPQPFRRFAELKGYYQTDRNNERVVPLSSVFRIRGSATDTEVQTITQVMSTKKRATLDERYCLELQVYGERFWYRLESAGGTEPPKGHGYKGFWRRLQHKIRGTTDWEGEKELLVKGDPSQLGIKEPWFADRRAFDDVIPLIRRK